MKNRLFVLIPILLVSIFNGGSLQAGEKNIALKAGIDFFSDHKIENGMTNRCENKLFIGFGTAF